MLPIASLPNPSEPSVVAFGAAVGAFYGSFAARRRGADRDEQTHAAIDWSYNGTAMALFVYIVANGLGVLGS